MSASESSPPPPPSEGPAGALSGHHETIGPTFGADPESPKKRGRGGLKRKKRGFFVRGLAVLLPTILTVFLFTTVWNFVNRHVVGPINGTIYGVLEGNGLGWVMLGAMDIDPYARVLGA